MGEPPSGTVTFLFTDIEGSTRLWEEHPDAMADALARHDAALRGAIESGGGFVVKTTGDGVLAAFTTAEDGLAAAIGAQVGLGSASWGETGTLRVRMGLHSGAAVYRDGDYHGPALNRAARLMSAGHGGQVLVSGTTAALVGDRLPEDAELVALGEHRLRDLGRPEPLFQLAHPSLARSFPPLRTLDSYPGNLPLQVSSFIGRERETARVVAALDEARVVTLTGVGGVGKTRLALQVAAEVLPRFREGAWLVELAPVRDPDGVPGSLAAVFGVSPHGGLGLTEALVEFLRTKQLLVVVDNCEHLLEAVAELVEALERSCAGLVVLATSREGLALDGERMIAVPSLTAPGAGAELATVAGTDAVRLFVERAQGVKADFALTPSNAAAIAQVCRRLDGVPLAIELAAARVAAMTPAELAGRLDRRFEVLAGGRRRAVERHQTLRAAIDWSYALLAEPDRRLLARLAVFAGGCTLEAVEVVCEGAPVDARAVWELLAGLVAQSLVVAEDQGGATRYRLLETIRQYSEERLDEHGETEALRDAHAEYYCRLVAQLSDEILGPHQIEAGRRLVSEHENLLAAIAHAIDTDDAGLALRIVRHTPGGWAQTGYELLLPVDAVIGLTGAADHPLFPYALMTAAFGAASRGELADVEVGCAAALHAAGRLGSDTDRLVEQFVLNTLAVAAMARGAWHDFAGHEERAAAIARAADRRYLLATHLLGAATGHTMAGEPDAGAPLASEALGLARGTGAPMLIAATLVALAGTLADRDPPRARSLLVESLQLRATLGFENPSEHTQGALVAARIGDWPLVLELASRGIGHLHWSGNRPYLAGVLNLVACAIAASDAEAAAWLQGAAHRLAPASASGVQTAHRPPPAESPSGGTSFLTEIRHRTTAALSHTLGEERLRELRAQGAASDEDHAVAHALDAIARAREDTGVAPP